jgi:hypothetical protein
VVTLGEARFSLGAGAGTKATADHSHALHTGRATAPPQRTLRLDLLFGATALTLFFLVHISKKPVAEWRRWSASLAVLERIRQVVRLRSGGKMRCSTTNEHPSQRQSLQTTTRMLRDSQPRAATCNPPRTATPSLGARKFKPVQFYTQNCRGLKTDSSLTELIHVAQWRDAFASCLQETWRPQDHEELCDLEGGHTFIGVGQAHNSAGRGSQGVGILLSPSATRAWHLAKTRYGRSHLVNDLGPRVLAVTLTLQETATKRAADVFLISAYAPTSAHSEDDWDAYC